MKPALPELALLLQSFPRSLFRAALSSVMKQVATLTLLALLVGGSSACLVRFEGSGSGEDFSFVRGSEVESKAPSQVALDNRKNQGSLAPGHERLGIISDWAHASSAQSVRSLRSRLWLQTAKSCGYAQAVLRRVYVLPYS